MDQYLKKFFLQTVEIRTSIQIGEYRGVVRRDGSPRSCDTHGTVESDNAHLQFNVETLMCWGILNNI